MRMTGKIRFRPTISVLKKLKAIVLSFANGIFRRLNIGGPRLRHWKILLGMWILKSWRALVMGFAPPTRKEMPAWFMFMKND